MEQEPSHESLPVEQAGLGTAREGDLSGRSEIDPYQAALEVFNDRVEQLKESGEIRRPSQITSEEELDDHFDDLWRVYRQVCLEMGLAWPPYSIE